MPFKFLLKSYIHSTLWVFLKVLGYKKIAHRSKVRTVYTRWPLSSLYLKRALDENGSQVRHITSHGILMGLPLGEPEVQGSVAPNDPHTRTVLQQ